MKRTDWPFPRQFPIGRTLVPKILRWVADTLIARESTAREQPGDPPDEVKELRKQKLRNEVRKLLAAAETAETALARERGRLVEAAEVEREWAGLGVVMRNAFQNLGAQLVPLALTQGMPHEAAPTFQQQIEEVVTGILRRLSSGGDGPEDDSDGA